MVCTSPVSDLDVCLKRDSASVTFDKELWNDLTLLWDTVPGIIELQHQLESRSFRSCSRVRKRSTVVDVVVQGSVVVCKTLNVGEQDLQDLRNFSRRTQTLSHLDQDENDDDDNNSNNNKNSCVLFVRLCVFVCNTGELVVV